MAVSAARVYRVGEGRDGFQDPPPRSPSGPAARPSPSPSRRPALLHAPAHGSDPGEARRLNPGVPPAGGTRARARGADSGAVRRVARAPRNRRRLRKRKRRRARRARRRVSSRRRRRTRRGFQKSRRCSQWWHVSADLPPGVAPVAPETPGGHTAAAAARRGDALVPDGRRRDAPLGGGVRPRARRVRRVRGGRGRRRARGRGLGVGLRRRVDGLRPQGWGVAVRDARQNGWLRRGAPRRRRRWSGAWRASAGAARPWCPRPSAGLFAATRDDLRGALERSELGASSGLRLFVTRAGEATKKEDELLEAEAEAAAAGTDLDALREDASPGPAVPSLDDDTCPICLEVPGAGGDGELYRYDLRTNPTRERGEAG